MEYKKNNKLLKQYTKSPTKFRSKNCVEINDDTRGMHNINSQVKFKTSMLWSSLCDYSDAYILMSGTITVTKLTAGGRNNNIQVVFKNCASFTNWISEINNTQIDDAKDVDVLMPIYNLIECSDNYSKTSRSLWQYYRDETALTDAGKFDNFSGNRGSFKFKQKILGLSGNYGAKAVQIMVPLE